MPQFILHAKRGVALPSDIYNDEQAAFAAAYVIQSANPGSTIYVAHLRWAVYEETFQRLTRELDK